MENKEDDGRSQQDRKAERCSKMVDDLESAATQGFPTLPAIRSRSCAGV